jgi:hypothetical protein
MEDLMLQTFCATTSCAIASCVAQAVYAGSKYLDKAFLLHNTARCHLYSRAFCSMSK